MPRLLLLALLACIVPLFVPPALAGEAMPFKVQAKVVAVLSADGDYWYAVRVDTIRQVFDLRASGRPGYLPGDRVLIRVDEVEHGSGITQHYSIVRHAWRGE